MQRLFEVGPERCKVTMDLRRSFHIAAYERERNVEAVPASGLHARGFLLSPRFHIRDQLFRECDSRAFFDLRDAEVSE
jgi:hypothetical protein